MFDKFKNVLKGFKKPNEVELNKSDNLHIEENKEDLEGNITDLTATRRIKTNVNAKHQNCVDLANELREYVKNTNIDDIEELIELRAKKNKNKKEERKQELKVIKTKEVEEIEVDPIEVEDEEVFIIDTEFDLLGFYRKNHIDMKIPNKSETAQILNIAQNKVRQLNYILKDLECIESIGNIIYLTEKGLKAGLEELEVEKEELDDEK